MGVAYTVKNGDMQLSDVDSNYRDKVKSLVDGMTLKQLKDFAETKHDNLPEEITEGIMKIDINRVITKIMGVVGFKQNPKMREELKMAFLEDIKEIMNKYDYVTEAEDHEVGMAMGQLEAIHKAAGELEDKIGNEEKDIPAWIQAHITSAYEYLKQANDNFHELNVDEADFYNLQPGNIGGMGPISLPGVDNVGSGDIPAGVGSAQDRYEEELKKRKKKNKKKKSVLEFSEFIKEQEQQAPFMPNQPKGEKLGEEDFEKGPANDPDAEFKERQKTLKKARGVVTFVEFRKM